MATKAQLDAETKRADENYREAANLADQLEVAKRDLALAAETIEDLERRVEWARASAKREHKRASAANIKNEQLAAENKGIQWRVKQLEMERMQDAYHARQLEIMTERLKLIREVAAPLTSNELSEAWRTR